VLYESTVEKIAERFQEDLYCSRLLTVLKSDAYQTTRLLCAEISLIFYGFIAPFIENSSGNKEHGLRKYSEIMETHKKLETQLLKVKDARRPFFELLRLTKNVMVKENEGFFTKVKFLLESVDDQTLRNVNQELLLNIERVKNKFDKEHLEFVKLNLNPDVKVAADNRAVGKNQIIF